MTVIRYERDDLRLFSEASHDWSRLHTSDEYARGTVYGEVIVFGIQGALASLGALRDRPGRELAKVSLTYRQALYMKVDYQARVIERSDDRASVDLIDAAGVTMMSSDFRFRPSSGPVATEEVAGVCPSTEQTRWGAEDLGAGIEVVGCYAPEPAALRRILDQWRLPDKGATPPQVAVLLWSSYLTGMHLPGLRGTSAQLRATFRPDGPPPLLPFHYRSRLLSFDERFRMLHSAAKLSQPEGVFADAEVWSHLRDDEATVGPMANS
jgi:hypothetical protein